MGYCRLCQNPCGSNSLFKNRFFREKFQDIICMWVDPKQDFNLTDVCKKCENEVVEFYLYKHQCRDIIRGVKNPTPLVEDHENFPLLEEESSVSDPRRESVPANRETEVSIVESSSELKTATRPKENEKLSKNSVDEQSLQSLLDNCGETVELSIEVLGALNSDENVIPAPVIPTNPEKVAPFKRKFIPVEKKRRTYTFKTAEERLAEKMRPKRKIQRKTEAEKAMDPAEYKKYYFKKTMERYRKTCEICGKRMQQDRWEGHMNGHKGLTPFKCEHCELQFNCRLNLRSHIQRMHVTGNEVNCPQCGKEFSQKRKLEQHIFSVHAEKKYQCSLCGLKILNRNSLQRHMNIHTQTRDFICPHCGKAFYCKSVLTIHLRTHSGETPYICNVCPKGFIHRRIYVMHMQKFHPGEPLMQLSGSKSMKETLMKKY
ncbi:zinc finger and BTB domain-containing protein 24-like [Armigeres subalbatus]|uniref:zinc finger and BTB domain-containing protein 24-like n=1 Tax=Armigeres subalbatus TaxID=124917 RepID=UPI002ED45BC9